MSHPCHDGPAPDRPLPHHLGGPSRDDAIRTIRSRFPRALLTPVDGGFLVYFDYLKDDHFIVVDVPTPSLAWRSVAYYAKTHGLLR